MLHIPYSLFVLVGVALGRLMVAQAMGGAEVWGNHKVLVALLVGNNLECPASRYLCMIRVTKIVSKVKGEPKCK